MSQKKILTHEEREKRDWFKLVTQIRCSVLPKILPRVIFCGVFALIISILHYFNFPISLPFRSTFVPNLVLGLLLVFRTNTAYERYWEGRKLWGMLINTVRNLARMIWVSIEEIEPEDREKKIRTLRLLVAFAVATKLHLRSEAVDRHLAKLMPHEWWEKLKQMNNPPLEIAFWIGDYLQRQYEGDRIDSYQLTAMFRLLDSMVDVLGGCERILKTPIPLAYSIHLKQLILIYCLTLPFLVVSELQWVTAPIICIVSFAIFGIEAIGIEIENPFGHDLNDLPLDRICRTMEINIEDLITLAPCVRHWQRDFQGEVF